MSQYAKPLEISLNYTEFLKYELGASDVLVKWLGQAGFAMRSRIYQVRVDPYLSDCLADKYRGCEFPHVRMMPPPVDYQTLSGIDYIFCTHRHSDHMDPPLLKHAVANMPACRFVLPRAEIRHGLELGIPEERMVAMNAGEEISLGESLSVHAAPSAHEDLKMDSNGNHHFLGYAIKINQLCLYHSGDCIPYEGLADRLGRLGIDAALLPVNGRDERRRSRGVPGNFTLQEAVSLCNEASIPFMIGHHYGMFEFNTIDPAIAEKECLDMRPRPQCCFPGIATAYLFQKIDVKGG